MLIDPVARTIGGLEVAAGPLSFGCWRFTTADVGEASGLVETALDLGMTLIDNADVYGLDWGGTGFGAAEELLGRVMAAQPGLRDRMILTTKGGIIPGVPYDSSPQHIRGAVDASLQRLGVDTIDLYLIHRPDMYTHPEAAATTLSELRDAGKVREVGVSNHTPTQTEALAAHLDFPLATTQPQFSAAHLDPLFDGTMDQAMRLGVVPLAWSPLAGGSLATGEGVRPELIAVLDRLANREGVSRSVIAYAFVLAHPSRPIAIVGTQRPERLEEAVQALDVTLVHSDVYDIIEASTGTPLP
ncbi:MAG: aldo/keto reductase [Acidimicrobiia bacterium]|nr:aldo/keto reductase [Acidimicrobiia bacterium]NNC74350.1 aldo/keto reductase [Acidimicrobiia bacterium]